MTTIATYHQPPAPPVHQPVHVHRDHWAPVRCPCGHRLHWRIRATRTQDVPEFADAVTGDLVRTCPRCGGVLAWPEQWQQARGWND